MSAVSDSYSFKRRADPATLPLMATVRKRRTGEFTRWGYNMKRLLREQGLTGREVCARMEMSEQQFSDLMNDPDARPTTETLQRVADQFGVDIAELWAVPSATHGSPATAHTATARPPTRAEIRPWLITVLAEILVGLEGNSAKESSGQIADSGDDPPIIRRAGRANG